MSCGDCQGLISEYIDGELELGERVRVERHLAGCDSCRAVRDDLIQIVHFSGRLPLHTPQAAVWNRIRSELADEGRAGLTSWLGRLLAESRGFKLRLSLPQIAVSAMAIVVVVSAAILVFREDSVDQSPGPTGEVRAAAGRNLLSNPDIERIETRIDQLRAAVDQRKNNWNPELRDAFERNLLYIDQSLVECRHQLTNDPADSVSQELMLNAYREKVRLLEGFSKF